MAPRSDLFDTLLESVARANAPSTDYDLNAGIILPAGRRLRAAAVLIPLIDVGGTLELILTKRSSALKHHPGQIAFPGGKVDQSDDGPIAAALREADEEIGLAQSNVEVLGTFPSHETVTGFEVHPVLSRVRADFDPKPEPGEVSEVFRVPFSHVSDPKRFSVQSRRWMGQGRKYYTVPWGPYYIWGATARILYGLAEQVTR